MALEADPSSPVMSSLPSEIASTIQAGHINRHPDPARDITPSTAAEKKSPVTLHHIPRDELDGIDDDDDEDIPYSVLRPAPPAHQLPPLPDLRFEQSYLRSIAGADTWWKVLLITVRDQVLMPLTQGIVYNLFLCGWQHWNRNAKIHGDSVGARARRWWYSVNNWKLPAKSKRF
jgi:hypothetical protein